MIRLLKDNKMLLYCLSIYLAGQFLFWYMDGLLHPVLLIAQEIAYFIAIILGVRLLVRSSYSGRKHIICSLLIALFSVNLLLLIHWVIVVYLNPEINWKLQGNNYEVDPWYYILYLPIINFLLAFLILVVTYVICKLAASKKVIL